MKFSIRMWMEEDPSVTPDIVGSLCESFTMAEQDCVPPPQGDDVPGPRPDDGHFLPSGLIGGSSSSEHDESFEVILLTSAMR